MNSQEYARRLIQEAIESLETARISLENAIRESAAHYAQLAIEKAAKAIISLYEEPEWTHDPSPQLRNIIKNIAKTKKEEIELETLADIVYQASPWHVWSTYGKEGQTPKQVAKSKMVDKLVEYANQAISIATSFVK